jgi:pyruvate,water dikinase
MERLLNALRAYPITGSAAVASAVALACYHVLKASKELDLSPAMLLALRRLPLKAVKGYGPSVEAECGGKGMQLGKMVELGLPVPPFVTCPTGVYDECVAQDAALVSLINSVVSGEGGKAELIQIQEAISRLVLPQSVVSDLRNFLRLLPDGSAVSCRSSATGEDSVDSSFAGQFDTVLNCRSEDQIHAAILTCWASLWKEHVLQYRALISKKGNQHMAVVVQLQIDSVAAGVAFSCNPSNGLQNEMVVESVWGQGEGMVQGEITPDHYVIDIGQAGGEEGGKQDSPASATSFKVMVREIKLKKQHFVLTEAGTEKQDLMPLGKRYRSTLSEAQLQQLATWCSQLREHYGRPVDVEFATASSGAVLLLQVRPVTAIAAVKLSALGRPKSTLEWTHSTVRLLRCNQQILKPLTKLGHYAWNGGVAGSPQSVRFGVKEALSDMLRMWFGKAWPDDNYCCVINGFMYTTQGQGEKPVAMPPPAWILKVLSFFGYFSGLERQCADHSKNRPLMRQLREWDDVRRPRFDLVHSELGVVDLSSMDLAELQQHYDKCLDNFLVCVRNHYFYAITITLPSGALVSHILRHLPGEDKLALFQLPSNPADIFNVGPGPQLQKAFNEGGEAAAAALTQLQDLKTGQHTDGAVWSAMEAMAARGDDIGAAVYRWKVEVQDRLLGQYDITALAGREVPKVMLQNLLDLIGEHHCEKNEQKRQAEIQRIRDAMPTESARQEYELRLKEACLMNRFRDERSLYGLLRGGGCLRRVVLELGRRVFKEEAAVMVFASKEEIQEVFEHNGYPSDALKTQLLERQDFYEAYSVNDAPLYIGGCKTPDADYSAFGGHAGRFLKDVSMGFSVVVLEEMAVNKKGAKELKGSAAAEGVYVGHARIIESSKQFGQIEQGDVVVIPFTNSSFNMVMKLCGAIVTEAGGMLSHAGIVSREMGIPCVTDCSSATQIIPNGAKVEVDGSNGTVRIIELPS